MSICKEIEEECKALSSPNDIKILLVRLTKEVDELITSTEAKLLLHDGKIAELCKYLKDNLSNSIRCLLFDMEKSGELDQIIGEAINTLLTGGALNLKLFGAKGDGITDDTESFKNIVKMINDDIQEVIIPAGNYVINDTIKFENISNVRFNCYGKIKAVSSKSNEKPIFSFVGSNDITLNNFDIESTLDQTEPAPKDHVRQNYNGSNRIGFYFDNCSNVHINDYKCENLYSDIWWVNTKSNDMKENLKVDKWTSKNTTNPLYASNIKNLFVDHADVHMKKELGDGNHYIYTSRNTENVYITNSKFTVEDGYIGCGFHFVNTATGEYIQKNININNIEMIAPSIAYIYKYCNCHISNSKFKQIPYVNTSKFNSQYTFAGYTNSKYEVMNCTFENVMKMFISMSSSKTNECEHIFKNCIVKNVHETVTDGFLVYTSRESSKNKILFDSSILNIQKLGYISGTDSENEVIIKDCHIKSKVTGYFVSVRNNTNIVKLINNVITFVDLLTQIVFNGGSVTCDNISFLSTYFYNVTSVGPGAERPGLTSVNSYKDNVLIQL